VNIAKGGERVLYSQFKAHTINAREHFPTRFQDAEARSRAIEAEETTKLHEENLLLKDEFQKLKQSFLDQEKDI